MSNSVSSLFVEKLRPKELSKMILLPRLQKTLGSTDNLSLHYLFCGSPGTGKTSAARILTSKFNTLFLNISRDGNIDTIREKISKFCSTISLNDNGEQTLKCIVLDEMEGGSELFYKSLRGVIEEFQSYTRFIGTTNYVQKLPESILSRFVVVDFDPIDFEEQAWLYDAYKQRASVIIKACGMEATDEACEQIVKSCFPDLRSLLNTIQRLHVSKIKNIQITDVATAVYLFYDLYEALLNVKTTSVDFYKFVKGSYAEQYVDVFNSLGNSFLKWLEENHNDKYKKSLPEIIYTVADWQFKSSSMIDPALALSACLLQLQTIIRGK